MKKISLRPYNSFGVDAYAKDFVRVESEKDIVEFLEKNKSKSLLILGGGTKKFKGDTSRNERCKESISKSQDWYRV